MVSILVCCALCTYMHYFVAEKNKFAKLLLSKERATMAFWFTSDIRNGRVQDVTGMAITI